MRSVRILALASALLAFAPAFAQDSFPDVPKNHWAYEALATMKKKGLLVGYPDGLYRGGRPMSRYEMAVAMHAAYTKLRDVAVELDAILRASGGSAFSDPNRPLKDALAALQAQVAAMRGYGDALANLRRASDTFELELTQLGVDVQAMKDELRGLAGRVGALERRRPSLDVSGDLNLWAGGGHTDGDHYGLTRDGRLTGIANKNIVGALFPIADRAGITRDLSILDEAAVTVASTNDAGVRVLGTLVLTNAFGQAPVAGSPTSDIGFGNQSDVFSTVAGNIPSSGLYGYGEGSGDLYLQNLVLAFTTHGVDLQAGRIEHRATPWILQRIDNTLYFANPRWDSGQYSFDGGLADTRLGPVKVTAYGGSTESVLSKNGVLIDPVRSGPAGGLFGGGNVGFRLQADRLAGGTATASVRGVGLRGDYLLLSADGASSAGGFFDQVQVYGGEADFRVGRFKVSGGLRQSNASLQGDHVDGLTDGAWDAKVAWASGRFDLWAQYRQVGLNYMAPGDWGRLGILRDPTNVRGVLGAAKVGLTRRLDLGLEGEVSHGLEDGDAAGSYLARGTDIGRYAVRLDGHLGRSWGAFVSYEQTHFSDLAQTAYTAGDPRYQWYGVGVVHGLGANARFSLAYEQSAIRNDYQVSGGAGANDFRGGFLTTQMTVKF